MTTHPLTRILDLMLRADYDLDATTFLLADLMQPERRISIPDDFPDDLNDDLTTALFDLATILDAPTD